MSESAIAATRNPDKLRAMAGMLAPWSLESQPAGTDGPEPIITDGRPDDALRTIAATKALQVARAVPGRVVVATDGGLLVPALADWAPTLTRRFTNEVTNIGRARALLARAAALRGDERRIVWMEAVSIAQGDRVLMTAVAMSLPGFLAIDLPNEAGDDSGDGFWLPMVWLSDPKCAVPSLGTEHWARLGSIARAYLGGAISSRR